MSERPRAESGAEAGPPAREASDAPAAAGDDGRPTPSTSLTEAHLLRLGAALLLLSLPALLAPSIGPAMDALYPQVDLARPYLSGLAPLLLYVTLPLCVLGTLVLVLTPGLLAALLLARIETAAQWLLYGFAASVAIVSVAAGGVQAALGSPLTGTAFVIVTMACSLVLLAVLGWRIRRGTPPSWPAPSRRVLGVALSTLGVPLALLVVLTPKLFWEAFNGDGAHAFECARLLLHQPVPFWPETAGHARHYPGLSTVANLYPMSWFVRLFGEHEAAARIPFLLFLAALYAAVIAAVRGPAGRRLGAPVHALIWMSLVAYALAMVYSATYDPYCADVALPATQDTMLMACFVGVVVAYVRKEPLWTAWFALLTLTTSPGGATLLGSALLGLLLATRPRPYRKLARLAVGLALCLALLAVIPPVVRALGLPGPGGEHGLGALLRKFHYLYPVRVQRLAFVLLPCGIYPAALLLGWRRADDVDRALWVVTALAFGTYFVIPVVSLHYFVPAMVLPLVVFWRQRPQDAWTSPRAWLAGCTVAAAVAIGLCLPTSRAIHTAARDVGRRIDSRGVPGYAEMDPTAFRALDLLGELFPLDAHPDVPHRAYGGSPLAWHYYSRHAPDDAVATYALLPAGAAAPAGAVLVGSNDAASIYVLDLDAWETDKSLQPAGSQGPRALSVPRDLLFGRANAYERRGVIGVQPFLKRLLGRE